MATLDFRVRRSANDVLLWLCNRVISRLPSRRLRLCFYRRAMGFELGAGVSIFMDTTFDTPVHLKVGGGTTINRGCRLDTRGRITIGQNVSISEEVCVLTADHDLQSPDFTGRARPVTIEDYAFIGTRAMILPGVTVGRGAAVAAGAVVTRDVPPAAIVAGVPARVIGSRNPDLRYVATYRRLLA